MNDSWDSARRHPTLTLSGLFTAGLVGVGLVSYVGPGGGALYASLVTGLCCGLLLALLGWRAIREGVDAATQPLRPLTAFNVLTAVAGLVLLAWGAATVDWPLALSGLPLFALGAGLMVVRRRVSRGRRKG
jgi:peptidoglycan biosynthesis protein MviN/MurJ (putative lipid II flippase)